MDAEAVLSRSLPTHPAAKKVLVDKYAEIALYDADENQREILAHGALEHRKKSVMKRALDEQVRVKQAAMLKERAQEREWLHREQARVLVWNDEEKKKIAEERSKYGQASQPMRRVRAPRLPHPRFTPSQVRGDPAAARAAAAGGGRAARARRG